RVRAARHGAEFARPAMGPSSRGPSTTMRFAVCMLAAVIAASWSGAAQESNVPDTARLQQMAARFAPTDIGADVSKLTDADRRVLAKLIAASKLIDALFLRQVWAGNEGMLLDLIRDDSPAGRARLHYFL